MRVADWVVLPTSDHKCIWEPHVWWEYTGPSLYTFIFAACRTLVITSFSTYLSDSPTCTALFVPTSLHIGPIPPTCTALFVPTICTLVLFPPRVLLYSFLLVYTLVLFPPRVLLYPFPLSAHWSYSPHMYCSIRSH